jgi:hypothetical protein
VQQHIRLAVVGHDKAITLGCIEPFDEAGHLDQIERLRGRVTLLEALLVEAGVVGEKRARI